MFSISVGYERAYLMSYLLFIRPPLETRKIHIHTVLFPEPKVRQRKLKYAKILSKTPRENYFLSEVMSFLTFSFLRSKLALIRFKLLFLFCLEETELMKA